MGDLHVLAEQDPADVSDAAARFDDLYEQHFSAMYAYCLRRVDAADVADLVADVFTVVWRRIEEVPAAPNDRLWIYGVAHRVVAQHVRGRRRRDRLVDRLRANNRPPSDMRATTDVDAQIADLLGRLGPEDREMVRLVVWERLSHEEVGVILGCSANAVAIRWHRSLGRIRRSLGLVEVPVVQTEGP